MTTCREFFTFSWPLRGRGRGGRPKRSAWPLFPRFFLRLPLARNVAISFVRRNCLFCGRLLVATEEKAPCIGALVSDPRAVTFETALVLTWKKQAIQLGLFFSLSSFLTLVKAKGAWFAVITASSLHISLAPSKWQLYKTYIPDLITEGSKCVGWLTMIKTCSLEKDCLADFPGDRKQWRSPVLLVNCQTIWSLLFIFGFLCWSSVSSRSPTSICIAIIFSQLTSSF